METVRGRSILPRIAIGPIRVLRGVKQEAAPVKSHLTPAQEWQRFQAARGAAKQQLNGLYSKALQEVGEETASIMEIHLSILDDVEYLKAVRGAIEDEGVTAERAASEAEAFFTDSIAGVEDPYLRERASDMRAVSQIVLDKLNGRDERRLEGERPAILVADAVTPGETVQMDKTKLLGLVTREGSPISHTSILARNMNIPSLVGLDYQENWDGRMAVLDGYSGCLHVDPPQEFIDRMETRQREDQVRFAGYRNMKGDPGITIDGRIVLLCGAVHTPDQVGQVIRNGGQTVGLYCQEDILPMSRRVPSEEELLSRYLQCLQSSAGRPLVIHTIPVGWSRKNTRVPRRFSGSMRLAQPDRLKTQMRAALRAGAFGTVQLLLCSVSSTEELQESLMLLETCRGELQKEGIQTGALRAGVLLDNSEAIGSARDLMTDLLFLSIDSGALQSYARENGGGNRELQIMQQTICQITEAGHHRGVPVGLTGELAEDYRFTKDLLREDLDFFSVAPERIRPLRYYIESLDLGQEQEQERVAVL